MKKVGSYILGSLIGKGHSSRVYLGQVKGSQKQYAIKQYAKDSISATSLKNIQNEISVLDAIDHPNVIKLVEKMRSSNFYYLVLEHCNGGDLCSLIKIVKKFSEEAARRILKQVLQGLIYLHNQRIIHRDLKLSNIYIHFPSMQGQEKQITQDWLRNVDLLSVDFVIKIGDLGFAKILLDAQEFSTTYCGTPINMAPEVLNRATYNYKADIWSLGTVAFEMLTGYSPFHDAKTKEQLKNQIKSQQFVVPKEVQISKDCLRFINVCLNYYPWDRPTYAQLLQHEFLKKEDCSVDQFQKQHNLFDSSDSLPSDKKKKFIFKFNFNTGDFQLITKEPGEEQNMSSSQSREWDADQDTADFSNINDYLSTRVFNMLQLKQISHQSKLLKNPFSKTTRDRPNSNHNRKNKLLPLQTGEVPFEKIQSGKVLYRPSLPDLNIEKAESQSLLSQIKNDTNQEFFNIDNSDNEDDQGIDSRCNSMKMNELIHSKISLDANCSSFTNTTINQQSVRKDSCFFMPASNERNSAGTVSINQNRNIQIPKKNHSQNQLTYRKSENFRSSEMFGRTIESIQNSIKISGIFQDQANSIKSPGLSSEGLSKRKSMKSVTTEEDQKEFLSNESENQNSAASAKSSRGRNYAKNFKKGKSKFYYLANQNSSDEEDYDEHFDLHPQSN